MRTEAQCSLKYMRSFLFRFGLRYRTIVLSIFLKMINVSIAVDDDAVVSVSDVVVVLVACLFFFTAYFILLLAFLKATVMMTTAAASLSHGFPRLCSVTHVRVCSQRL